MSTSEQTGRVQTGPVPEGSTEGAEVVPRAQVRRLRPATRRTTGRERHDEKITVYVSPDELVALEQARLVLRAEHGVSVDRGRLVREAVAEMLIDLEAHGEASVVVQRLRTE
jgi:hypothetical protein